MKPGIYRDFDGEAYFADPCPQPSLTQSIAKVIVEKSALHAMWEHPRLAPAQAEDEETEKYVKAQAIGNAAHKLVLGRGKDIVVVNANDFRGKEAQAARDDANAAGHVPILAKHMARAELMALSCRQQLDVHEDADAFTAGHGEVMICWEEDGLWFRSLIDWLHDDLRTVDDFKTTGMSVAPHVLGARAEGAGWHIQAAMIERGLDILAPETAGRRRFRFIGQENEQPFALSVMHMNEHWLTMGRKQLDYAINVWRQAMQSGVWEGYPRRGIAPEFPGYRESVWLDREIQYAEENERRAPRPKMLTSLAGG
jgi:hypothetical protein